MANRVQILDKIERNCKQLGIVTSRSDAATLVAGGITITYVDAVIASPMGGVDGSVSPFLGIGIAAPGKINLSANPTTLIHLQVLRVACGHANTVVIPLGELQGSADMLGMGM
ncbi:hypothetical protein UFOVP53_48 [uncultured Caudovirales phage]|uniref:Uncharacterized protein n=1 Tax=uncultured Caudovirales phage TaxID=2100421 RepID=A0A6J5KSU5_9CAUD|nr:hypothetical protein UFOVP53_48 [uncultured Caudovirales phage]